MRFRAKLMAVVASAAVSFLVLIAASTVIASRVDAQLSAIQSRYLPRMELGPQLEAQFDRLRRAFQDAVAARDPEALERTREARDAFLNRLTEARAVVEPGEAAALRAAVEDYHRAAYDVSRRLLADESGEGIVEAMAAMQSKQVRAEEILKRATAVDRIELSEAFAATARAQSAGARARLWISLACLLFALLLSFLLSRGALRSVEALEAGFARFGLGAFGEPIVVTAHDEFHAVAHQANRMAENLQRLQDERARSDWLRDGMVGLAQELRGGLEPEEVARRVTRYLAAYLEAPCAALYVFDAERRELSFLAGHAHAEPGEGERSPRTFRAGEGLVGQAAQEDALTVIEDPPAAYLRVRSGLGEGAPRALVLTPLVSDAGAVGVLELAFFKAVDGRARDLLTAARASVGIALAVAKSRAETRELLARTQRQAERLTVQEEALRATNEELQTQQEELRQTNEELTQQAEELELQRRVLEQRNLELDQTRRRLEENAKELTAVSAYKSQFLANMSHELRTPLNSMLLLSNLLAENAGKNLTAKQVEYAQTVHSAGSDLLQLINQVLDLAKVEAGKQEVHVAPMRLADAVAHAERVFGPVARDKGLGFVAAVEPGLPESIATDAQRLIQILNNLLGNAIKFTDRGEVTLRIERPKPDARLHRVDVAAADCLALVVSDTGVGIPSEHQERIFAPFEQVESHSSRRFGGTGLGLSIAREMAGLLGGELQLSSTVGKGSTFTCFLPLATVARSPGEVEKAPRRASSLAAPLPRPTSGPGPARRVEDDRASLTPGDAYVLVIEDDVTFAGVVGDVAHEQGLKFVVAPDGKTGVETARAHKPTGVVLDVHLPDVDGWKIMADLRADSATADVPVHFVSAVDAPERGLSLGAVGYLTKPASRSDVVRAVSALAPKAAERACRVLVVEDDPATGKSLLAQLADERIEARCVSSAREAVNALEKDRYACMVLDLSLPDMDGLELLQTLQERCGKDMPAVVVYTARALSVAEARRLEAYAEAIVLKEGSSTERLIDEIRLFARRLRDGLGPRRPTAPVLHPVDVQLSGKRVLVVDDDMRTVYALSATLRAKGVEVLVADTGKVALSTLGEHPDVDIVLMDVMMPEMDGYEATRRIRQIPRFAKLPIVALTAKAMKGDREKCLEAGASDYLPKPIDPVALLGVLHRQLSGSARNGS